MDDNIASKDVAIRLCNEKLIIGKITDETDLYYVVESHSSDQGIKLVFKSSIAYIVVDPHDGFDI